MDDIPHPQKKMLVLELGENCDSCIFAGAARRAWPDSKLILCGFVCEFV